MICGLFKLLFSILNSFMVDIAKKSLLELSIYRKLVLIYVSSVFI